LTDLEEARLVITPDYVGPPRRRDDRSFDSDQAAPPPPVVVVEPGSEQEAGLGDGEPRSKLRPVHLVAAVLATVVVVVPLTLVAAHVL
jgi:hypothetical protein